MIRGASPSVYVVGRMRAVPRRADPPYVFRFWFGRLRGSAMNPMAVGALAQAIQTQEGYYPGSRAYRNNNPGNLMYVGQAGATRDPDGFAVFASYSDGYSALVNQIQLDAVRGTDAAGRPVTTIGQLINSWAPASDPRNDTAAYLASVTAQTGFDSSTPLYLLGGPATGPIDVSGGGDLLDVSGDAAAGSAGVSPWWLVAAAGVAAVAILS